MRDGYTVIDTNQSLTCKEVLRGLVSVAPNKGIVINFNRTGDDSIKIAEALCFIKQDVNIDSDFTRRELGLIGVPVDDRQLDSLESLPDIINGHWQKLISWACGPETSLEDGKNRLKDAAANIVGFELGRYGQQQDHDNYDHSEGVRSNLLDTYVDQIRYIDTMEEAGDTPLISSYCRMHESLLQAETIRYCFMTDDQLAGYTMDVPSYRRDEAFFIRRIMGGAVNATLDIRDPFYSLHLGQAKSLACCRPDRLLWEGSLRSKLELDTLVAMNPREVTLNLRTVPLGPNEEPPPEMGWKILKPANYYKASELEDFFAQRNDRKLVIIDCDGYGFSTERMFRAMFSSKSMVQEIAWKLGGSDESIANFKRLSQEGSTIANLLVNFNLQRFDLQDRFGDSWDDGSDAVADFKRIVDMICRHNSAGSDNIGNERLQVALTLYSNGTLNKDDLWLVMSSLAKAGYINSQDIGNVRLQASWKFNKLRSRSRIIRLMQWMGGLSAIGCSLTLIGLLDALEVTEVFGFISPDHLAVCTGLLAFLGAVTLAAVFIGSRVLSKQRLAHRDFTTVLRKVDAGNDGLAENKISVSQDESESESEGESKGVDDTNTEGESTSATSSDDDDGRSESPPRKS